MIVVMAGERDGPVFELLEECPACGASVGRWHESDFWRCDRGHTIYRGRERMKP